MNVAPTEAASATAPLAERARPDIPFIVVRSAAEIRLVPVFTFVLWTGCVLIGAAGFALPYLRPHPVSPEKPLTFEMLNVELTDELDPPALESPAPDPLAAPPDAILPPTVPAPIPVVQPSPAIAFALPVEGPVRVVEPRPAAYAQPVVEAASISPGPQTLTFGQGEGRQPKPDYPLHARREGQEGTVVIRLTVGENGRVIAAEAASPSPWPLLNESALRAVRERWRFTSGKLRAYEVSIRFELTK